jgi:hypothetical protein
MERYGTRPEGPATGPSPSQNQLLLYTILIIFAQEGIRAQGTVCPIETKLPGPSLPRTGSIKSS